MVDELVADKVSTGSVTRRETWSWSSGQGRRLAFKRLWVQIPALDTGWTFFTLYCWKNCNFCLKKAEINKKEAENCPFFQLFKVSSPFIWHTLVGIWKAPLTWLVHCLHTEVWLYGWSPVLQVLLYIKIFFSSFFIKSNHVKLETSCRYLKWSFPLRWVLSRIKSSKST